MTGTGFISLQPGGPESADVAAAGDGRKVIHVPEYSQPRQGLEHAKIESSATNATAGEREAEAIVRGETNRRFPGGAFFHQNPVVGFIFWRAIEVGGFRLIKLRKGFYVRI